MVGQKFICLHVMHRSFSHSSFLKFIWTPTLSNTARSLARRTREASRWTK